MFMHNKQEGISTHYTYVQLDAENTDHGYGQRRHVS